MASPGWMAVIIMTECVSTGVEALHCEALVSLRSDNNDEATNVSSRGGRAGGSTGSHSWQRVHSVAGSSHGDTTRKGFHTTSVLVEAFFLR